MAIPLYWYAGGVVFYVENSALDTSALQLSYPITSLAYHITIILISTLL